MGLGMDDFCRLTPREFQAAYDSWAEGREALTRDSWERMRMLATITIQPHVRKKLRADELLPLPWDGKGKSEAAEVSAEEDKERLERLVKRMRR